MVHLKNKSGFTLIEIIIVIVIIGVLASLALPRLTNQVRNAQATEAITVLGKFMKSIDQCYQIRESVGECDTMDEVRDFSYSTSFTYNFLAAANANVSVEAHLGAPVADVMTFTLATDTGVITKTVSSAGNYRGLMLR